MIKPINYAIGHTLHAFRGANQAQAHHLRGALRMLRDAKKSVLLDKPHLARAQLGTARHLLQMSVVWARA